MIDIGLLPFFPVCLHSYFLRLRWLQKGDDPGKFRQLDEIVFIDGYPGYQHLLQIAEKSMRVVCEVKGHSLKLPYAVPSWIWNIFYASVSYIF